MKYVVISPVRNEAKHFHRTIDSMIRQSIPPAEWIIVDDGSDDGTPQIAQEAARMHPWIKVVQRMDRGHRKSGAGVVEAFYEGFNQLAHKDWNLLIKLDGDLEFAADFFERLSDAFEADDKLGVAGGEVVHFEDEELVIESKGDPDFHVRGAVKAYSRTCWDGIGGLVSLTGWDTLDEVKAIQLGWKTRRVSGLNLIHLKPTGAADGTWKNAYKNGKGSFISGYHPLFILLRACRSALAARSVVVPMGLIAGYFGSYLSKVRRVDDKELVSFLRAQQLRRMLGMSSMWK